MNSSYPLTPIHVDSAASMPRGSSLQSFSAELCGGLRCVQHMAPHREVAPLSLTQAHVCTLQCSAAASLTSWLIVFSIFC